MVFADPGPNTLKNQSNTCVYLDAVWRLQAFELDGQVYVALRGHFGSSVVIPSSAEWGGELTTQLHVPLEVVQACGLWNTPNWVDTPVHEFLQMMLGD